MVFYTLLFAGLAVVLIIAFLSVRKRRRSYERGE